MKRTAGIARLGMLAMALGIGAAVAATAGVASAHFASADLVPPFDPNDFAVSIDGKTVIQDGTATASSGQGDIAIADGPGAVAIADSGTGDKAIAFGADSITDIGHWMTPSHHGWRDRVSAPLDVSPLAERDCVVVCFVPRWARLREIERPASVIAAAGYPTRTEALVRPSTEIPNRRPLLLSASRLHYRGSWTIVWQPLSTNAGAELQSRPTGAV